jgi:hypothetical protein
MNLSRNTNVNEGWNNMPADLKIFTEINALMERQTQALGVEPTVKESADYERRAKRLTDLCELLNLTWESREREAAQLRRA